MRGLLSLCCVAVLVGPVCAQEAAKDQGLYPLKKGAKWTYKAGTDTVEVLVKGMAKVRPEDKEEAFELVTSLNGSPVASELVAVKSDGLYRVKVGRDEVKPPMLFLKLGAKKGDSWMISSAIGPENLTGKFTRGEAEVEWNKEKKQAVTVSGPDMTASGQKLALSYTYLENVGVFAQSMSLGGIQVKLELTKYEPPKE